MRKKIATYDAANREAAERILASPEKHEGLMLEWAKLWRANHEGRNDDHRMAGCPASTAQHA